MQKRLIRVVHAASAVALVAVSLGAVGVTAGSAGAADQSSQLTIGCRGTCFSLYSQRLGTGTSMNAVLPDETGTGGRAGRKINMLDGGIGRPSGEFTASLIGRVYQFCGSDVHDFYPPASYLCTHEWNDWVFEAAWSPYGIQSGLCVGVGTAGEDGESVTLRPCGRSAHTLWIAGRANGTGSCRTPGNYCPWISGADFNFRRPFVLTLDTRTTAPVNQLRIERLELTKGQAATTQQFSFVFG